VETVYSIIKRRLGAVIQSRSYWSQCLELLLVALTYNIRLEKRFFEVFYRALLTRFSPLGVEGRTDTEIQGFPFSRLEKTPAPFVPPQKDL
jgi:hypothetical protein